MGDNENKKTDDREQNTGESGYETRDSSQETGDQKTDGQDIENNSTIQQLNDLTSQLEDQKSKYLGLMAEFQNYKKRIEAEKAMFGALANMDLIQDDLEVFDDINLALNDENLDFESSKAALKSAQDKLISSIERAGVERVDVKVGDEFNKDTMEAISTIVSDEDKKGKVVAVINSAFKYKDRDGIIKPAKVIVGK